MDKFDIYFSGKLLSDADPAQARDAIGRRFQLQGKALERLFRGDPMRIKKDLDVEAASQFRAIFREMGALIDIVPAGSQPPRPAASTGTQPPAPAPAPSSAQTPAARTVAAASEPDMELLPPRTGSLEDCAVEQEAQVIPDTDWMPLDQPGIELDQRAPPPPLTIDISALSMGEANSGTLEDCHVDKPPTPIGDTSWMELDGPGVILDTTPPPAEPQIDISTLEVLPSGSDLDDGSDKDPAPAPPDVSHIKLDER